MTKTSIDGAMDAIKQMQRHENLNLHTAMRYNSQHHKVTELGDAALDGDKQTPSDKLFIPLYLRRHAQSMINKGEWLSSNQFSLLLAIEAIVREFDDYVEKNQEESNRFYIQKVGNAINQLRSIAQNFTVQADEFWPNGSEYSGDLFIEHPQMSSQFVRVTEALDELPCELGEDGYTVRVDDLP